MMEFKMYFSIHSDMGIEVVFKEGHSETIEVYKLTNLLKPLLAFKFNVNEQYVRGISKSECEKIEKFVSIEI